MSSKTVTPSASRKKSNYPAPRPLVCYTQPPPPGSQCLMGYGFHISPKYLRSTEHYMPPTDEQLSEPGLSVDDKMILQMSSEAVASCVLEHIVHEFWKGAKMKLADRGPHIPARILVLADNINRYPPMPTEDEVATIREKLNLHDAQLGWYRVDRCTLIYCVFEVF